MLRVQASTAMTHRKDLPAMNFDNRKIGRSGHVALSPRSAPVAAATTLGRSTVPVSVSQVTNDYNAFPVWAPVLTGPRRVLDQTES
jgi:hypothetical protein